MSAQQPAYIPVDLAKVQSWINTLNLMPHNQVRDLIDDITGHINEQFKKIREQAASQSSVDAPQPQATIVEASQQPAPVAEA